MKCSLSGNTWSGSTWDGTSKYTKKTQEENADGSTETITADFRKYASVEDSVADYSAYLLGAKNGSALRYAGLAGETDYTKAIQIIKDGGYATSSTYVSNICSIIEKWNLTQYDVKTTASSSSTTSTTSSSTTSASSTTSRTASTVTTFPATPFTVKVLISDLNYRSEPSMSGTVKGQTGKGTFTIVKVSGSWGKLKSGAGWIYLGNSSYCTIGKTVSTTTSTTTTTKTTTTTTKTKSVTELAKEVIAGKWGNGTARKDALTKAGYDYSAVQKKVNELLS